MDKLYDDLEIEDSKECNIRHTLENRIRFILGAEIIKHDKKYNQGETFQGEYGEVEVKTFFVQLDSIDKFLYKLNDLYIQIFHLIDIDFVSYEKYEEYEVAQITCGWEKCPAIQQ